MTKTTTASTTFGSILKYFYVLCTRNFSLHCFKMNSTKIIFFPSIRQCNTKFILVLCANSPKAICSQSGEYVEFILRQTACQPFR